jgi:hypothetical protein
MTDRLWAQGPTATTGAVRRSSLRDGSGTSDDGEVARRQWLREPKSAVWMALALIVLIGGGRRLLWSWRARRAVARLGDPSVTPEDVEAVADYGRSGAWDLLRIFSTTESEPLRNAAGRALARLWRDDELVPEEEKSLVRRGYSVTWTARRRYPRALHAAIPIVASYHVPFLPDDPAHVRGEDLEWSHRILGARRATLEEFSDWHAGGGEVAFSIIADDFPTNGPHRLVLQTRVRTRGLSDAWELELPHMPFQFDFDPVLRLDAILTVPDAARDEAIAQAIRLESVPPDDVGPGRSLAIGGGWVLRHPPRLSITTPLPSDLSHRVEIEFEGCPGRFPAGSLVLSEQGLGHAGRPAATPEIPRFDVVPDAALPEGLIDRPGLRRVRVHLTADPQRGWAHPGIRSVWPGQTATNWAEVEIMRQ